jgi:hypothetical protein
MATDFREQVKTVEEFRDATTFLYTPVIMALKNKARYDAQDADVRKFATFDVEKDSIKAEILTTEQTEKHAIKGKTSDRVFNIYLGGAKAMVSFLNKHVNLQKSHDKVIREYLKIWDKWGLGGDRGNNGLLVSSDPNRITLSSHQIPAIPSGGTGWNQIKDLGDVFTNLALKVDQYTGDRELVVYVYGESLITLLKSITESNETVVQSLMEQKFSDKDVRFVLVPSMVLPASLASANGIVVVSQNSTVLEMCQEPDVRSNGTNDEDDYYWANYTVGSVQVSAEDEGGIIAQPITFA